jgi:hypothetical protein
MKSAFPKLEMRERAFLNSNLRHACQNSDLLVNVELEQTLA